MPSQRTRACPTASAAAVTVVPASPAIPDAGVARERSSSSQWRLVNVFAAATCRRELTVIPGGHGGCAAESQAA